jgi:hypothetical protein
VELVRRTKGTIVVGSQIPPDDEELELLLDEDELELEELEELLLEDELDELLEEELELEELEELLLEEELLDDELELLLEVLSSPVQVGGSKVPS